MKNTFGEMLQYYRKKRGLSQARMEDAYYSRKHIGNVERGESIPTLEFVECMSNRLSVDLYNTYSKARNYPDFESFLLGTEMTDAIEDRDYDKLAELVERAETMDAFSEGEAKKTLCYSRGLLLANAKKYKAAAEANLQGINTKLSTDEVNGNREWWISPVDNALNLGYAVNLARIGNEQDALKVVNNQIRRIKQLLDSDYYISDQNKDLWIKAICSFVYNKYVLSITDADLLLEDIDYVLKLERKKKSMHMLMELLLAKAAIMMSKGETEEAVKQYNAAKGMGYVFCGEEDFKKKAEAIINIKSNVSFF